MRILKGKAQVYHTLYMNQQRYLFEDLRKIAPARREHAFGLDPQDVDSQLSTARSRNAAGAVLRKSYI